MKKCLNCGWFHPIKEQLGICRLFSLPTYTTNKCECFIKYF